MTEVKAYLDGFLVGTKNMISIFESELVKIQEEVDNQPINKALQRVTETGMVTLDLENEKGGRLLLVDYDAFEDVDMFTDANGYINIKMKPTKTVTNSARWGNSEGLKEGVFREEGE